MAASDWEGYRNRIDQEWRARRASAQESGSEPAAWLRAPSSGPGPGEFSVDSFADRLLGGPGAELYGGSGGLDSGRFAVVPSPGPDFSGMDPDAIPPLPMGGADDEEVPDQGSGLVRPYFRTKGRTRPSRDLAIEALVSTSERGRVLDRVRVAEHRSICDLCLDTRSVAEVAALLRLPLGVVRVLIGDVVGLGLVLVHSAGVSAGDRPNIEFMERVLSGLRRI